MAERSVLNDTELEVVAPKTPSNSGVKRDTGMSAAFLEASDDPFANSPIPEVKQLEAEKEETLAGRFKAWLGTITAQDVRDFTYGALYKGPEQLAQQTAQTLREDPLGKPEDSTQLRAQTTSSSMKAGADAGAAITSAVAGGVAVGAAAIAAPVTLPMVAAGAALGSLWYGISRNTDEGNEIDLVSTVTDKLNFLTHKPGDTNLEVRMKNLGAGVLTEGIATGVGTLAGAVARRTALGTKSVIKNARARLIAKNAAAVVDEVPVEAVTPEINPKLNLKPKESVVDVSDEEVLAEVQREATKVTEIMRAEGVTVDDAKVIAALEAADEAATPEIKPRLNLKPKDSVEIGTANPMDELLTQEELAAPIEASASFREAMDEEILTGSPSDQELLRETYRAMRDEVNPNSPIMFERIYTRARQVTEDPAKIQEIIKKTQSGEKLNLIESSALHLNAMDKMVEVLSISETSPQGVLKQHETLHALVASMNEAIIADTSAARESSKALGMRNFNYNKYEAALPNGQKVNPFAQIEAMKEAINLAGGRAQTQEELKRWLEVVLAGAVPDPAIRGTIHPDNVAAVVAAAKQALKENTAEAMDRIAKVSTRSTGRRLADAVEAYRINNMLASVGTPMRVVQGAATHTALETVSKWLKIPLSVVASRTFKYAKADTVEALAHSSALFSKISSAAKLARKAAVEYKPGRFNAIEVGRLESDYARRIKNANMEGMQEIDWTIEGNDAWSMIRRGSVNLMTGASRVLYTADAFFSHLNYEAKLAGDAAYARFMQNVERGGTMAEALEYAKDPSPQDIAFFHKGAMEAGDKAAFRADIEIPTFERVHQTIRHNRALRMLTPFSRAGFNYVERMYEYLPGLSEFLPSVRQARASGDPRAIAQVNARIATGVAGMYAAYELFEDGTIVGDIRDGKVFDDKGRRVEPWSIKVGDSYVPIRNVVGTGVLEGLIKVAGGMHEAMDYAKDGMYEGALGTAVIGTLDSLQLGERFNIFGDLADVISKFKTDGAKGAGERFVIKQMTTLYPMFRLAKEVGPGTGDKVILKTSDQGGFFENIVKGMGQEFQSIYYDRHLALKPNYFGEEIQKPSGLMGITDAYSAPRSGEGDGSPVLEAVGMIENFGQKFNGAGYVFRHKEFPDGLSEQAIGGEMKFNASLAEKYRRLVQGYAPDGTILTKYEDDFQGAVTFREATYNVLNSEQGREVLKLIYEDKMTRDTYFKYEDLAIRLNRVQEIFHAQAAELLRQDPEYVQMLNEATIAVEHENKIRATRGGM